MQYIFSKYSKSEVARAFGMRSSAALTSWDSNKPTVTQIHLLGLQEYFQIPLEVFDNEYVFDEALIEKQIAQYKTKLAQEAKAKKIYNSFEKYNLIPTILHDDEIQRQDEIDSIVVKYKKQQREHEEDGLKEIFHHDEEFLESIKGVWYGYLHTSNEKGYWAKGRGGINTVKTTIYSDYSVEDEWGNKGVLKIGDKQSFIIKVSDNEGDINIIRFHNRQARYGNFRFVFVIVSNQNGTTNEMVNFGFFSRHEYSPEEAREILGDKSKLQLKLDSDFNERVMIG